MTYNTEKLKWIKNGGKKPLNYDTPRKSHKKFGSMHGSSLTNALKAMKEGIAKSNN